MAKKKTNGSDKEEEAAVLQYLKKTNRPYSATDIFNNLHAKYTKGAITKALDQLVRDDLVVSKVYGKMSIYSIRQSPEDAPTPSEMKEMQKTISELKEKQEELVDYNRKLEQSLAKIMNDPTTEEAKASLEKLQTENAKMKERLEKLKSGTVLIPPEKRKRVDDDFKTTRAIWQKRRRMFREIFKTVTEHYTGDVKALKEDLGIEEDPVPFEQDPLQDDETSNK